MSHHDTYITNGFIYCSFSEVNIIAMRLGPGKHLQGRTLLRGLVNPDDFDYFHEVCDVCSHRLFLDTFEQAIIHMELARVSSRAVVDGLLAGLVIGLPPILNYGTPELQRKVVPDVRVLTLYI